MIIKNRDILEVAEFVSEVIPIYSNEDFKNKPIGSYYTKEKKILTFGDINNIVILDPAYTIDKGIYTIYAFILI